MRALLLVLLFGLFWGLLGVGPCHAQGDDGDKKTPKLGSLGRIQRVQIGVGISGLNTICDLMAPGEAMSRFYPGGNFSFQFESQRRLYFQMNFGLSRQVMQDRSLGPTGSIQPNRFAANNLFYLTGMLRVRLLRKTSVRPHIGFGAGFLIHNPEDELGKSLNVQSTTRAPGESYGNVAPVFPLSLGFNWNINRVFAMGLDYTFYLTATDYLDNVGKLGRMGGPDFFHGFQLNVYTTFWPRKRSGRNTGKSDLLIGPAD